ncbi:hypothetical protein ECIV_ORF59 [European chub iridovirus]|nr:hypothetical protein ECIV_ORF59 [European chub iridovirus]
MIILYSQKRLVFCGDYTKLKMLLCMLTLWWCCLQYSTSITFTTTEVSENFLKEQEEECYIQSSFAASREHYGLSDSHIDLKMSPDNGVILTGAYASEGKSTIETRVTEGLKKCQSDIQDHFTNVSRDECKAKGYMTVAHGQNTTVIGSIEILIANVSSETYFWVTYDTSPLINVTAFSIASDGFNCSEDSSSCTISNVTMLCMPFVVNYTISVMSSTTDLELTQTQFLQMMTLIVTSDTNDLGTMCQVWCANGTSLIDTSNKYYPTVNLTTEGNCTLQTQRATKVNRSVAVQLSVSNVRCIDSKQYEKCNRVKPNYLRHYYTWPNVSCFESLINTTHCNRTWAPIVFSLFEHKSNESLMLLNATFPLVLMFQDYNSPLRAKDVSYVHCQRDMSKAKRYKRSIVNIVDRTSNYMMCIMQGYSDNECVHLNNRIKRIRRAPPPIYPEVPIPQYQVRMSTVHGGDMQRLNDHTRLNAQQQAHNRAGVYAGRHQMGSMEDLISHSQQARSNMYSRAHHQSTPNLLESSVPRSPLNTDPNSLMYSQVGPRWGGSVPQLPQQQSPYADLPLPKGGPIIRGGTDGATYSSIRRPGDVYATVNKSPKSDLTYASIKHAPLRPSREHIPPRDDIAPGNPPPRPSRAHIPPPRPSRDHIPPPRPSRDHIPPPTKSKLSNFFDKFKPKKSAPGGGGGCVKRAATCSLNMRGKPFGGNGKMPPKLSKKPISMLDPDGNGKYGMGKTKSLGNGEHVHIGKNRMGSAMGNNPMGMMMGAMMISMMSHQMSASTKGQINDIITGKYSNMDQGRAIALVVLQKFDELGSTMTTAGATAAMMGAGPVALAVAAVGLATQMIVGYVTMSIQIYDIRFPRDPPLDPILEKYTEYANMMNSPEAGNTWCLMPESILKVTMSFDDKTNIVKKDSVELWVSTYKTVIKVAYNVDLIFNADLQVTCAGGGQLRFDDFNSNSVATKVTSTTGGSSVYNVHGVGLMISSQSVIKGTCGGSKEPNLLMIREEIPSSEMILLRKRGPGEPEGSENMHSDVCDKFPFKKFYVAMSGCSADRSKTHVAWTTCSMLFRKSVWNSADNMWMVANPFVLKDSDRKIFVFKRRDFRNSFPISPNTKPDHAKLCNNADQPYLCRLPDPMIVTDNRMCNNKLRFYRVYLKSGNSQGYSSNIFNYVLPNPLMQSTTTTSRNYIGYMLTCPLNTIATYLMKKGDEDTNLKVHDIDTFGSVRKFFLIATDEHSTPVVWIFCQHSTKVGHQSDVIELQLERSSTEHKPLYLNTAWLNDNHTRFAMYQISRRGPMYQGPYIYVDVNSLPDFRKSVRSNKAVKLFVSGGSNNINEEWDLVQLENHWMKNGANTWSWASSGCKTISSLQVNFGLCNVTNSGQLEMMPLGWWTWSFLDQTQQGSTTKYIASNEWVFKPGNTSQTIGSVTYTHKMKGCNVKLSLSSKKLSISCDMTDLSKDDLTDSETCLTVSPASDQCNTHETACGTRTKEWYHLEDKRTQWEGGHRYTSNWHNTPGSEPQLAYQFFCQDEGVYWSHIDNNKRYSVIVYQRPLDANMPIIASYQSGNTISPHDYVIEASKMKLVQNIQDHLVRLFDLTKDPMAEAINELSRGLLGMSPNITRVNIDVRDLLEAKRMRDESISEIQVKLDDMMMDLMIDAIQKTDWFKHELNITQYKCCYVNVNDSSVTSVDKDIYNCPSFEYFMEDPDDVNFTHILGPDGNYHDRRVIAQLFGNPHFTCLAVQDIVFEDNETLQMFTDMLLEEMVEEELMLMSDNITYNVLLMQQDQEKEKEEPDGFFESSRYEYSVSPKDYDLRRIRSVNYNSVSLVAFAFVMGIVIMMFVWYVSYKCKRSRRQYKLRTSSPVYRCPKEELKLNTLV